MSNRKRVFFTSDTHYFHENVIKFSNRPFRDIDHMHQVLINNYNSVVGYGGVCYFLGDFGFAGSAEIKRLISKLKGTKIIILGNHDKGVNAMYNVGFDAVLMSSSMIISGERVTMSHCPLLDTYRENTLGMKGYDGSENWHGEKRHSRFSLTNEGQFHLHGHIHSPNGGKSKRIEGRQIDVGVDANNYYPLSISKIESDIVKILRNE